jgi:MYXO-CTERM domain-containing protein
MPEETRRVRFACAACGKVGFYPAGQPIVCKSCGVPADPALAAPAPTPTTRVAAVPVPAPALPPAAEESSTLLAGVALACGVIALVGVWAFPFSILLALAAVVAGSIALSNARGNGGVQAMGGIAVGLGGLTLLVMLLFVNAWDNSSTWNWNWDWGWWQSDPNPPPQHSVGVDVPAPAAAWLALALAGLAALRRR